MILLNDNKILKNKEGKAIISHNIPFTPICEKYISYDSANHLFTKTNEDGERENDFIALKNLCGDFEISFKVNYNDVNLNGQFYLVVKKQKLGKAKGFYSWISRTKQKEVRALKALDYYYYSSKDFIGASSVAKFDKHGIDYGQNVYWRIIRINGEVYLYVGNELYYIYKDKYNDENLMVWGSLNSKGTSINISIKQL